MTAFARSDQISREGVRRLRLEADMGGMRLMDRYRTEAAIPARADGWAFSLAAIRELHYAAPLRAIVSGRGFVPQWS